MFQNEKCHYNASGSGATVTGLKEVEKMNEEALQQAIVEVGPISVCIDVVDSFFRYKEG